MTTDLVCVADVAAEPVRWLWSGRIPLGKLTVLDGDPGMGKSTLTLTITAKVTTGSPFPDGARPEPADVILLSAEDEIGDTIRPRLEAAGADVNRVFVLPDVQEEDKPPRPPELPLDLDRLEAMIKERAAALVVVDPIAAFLSGAIDMHRDQDVRRALAPIAYMAARAGAAVLIVRHMNKSGGANPLYRGGGSIGIVGAARSGLLAAPDPDDEGRRILAVTKSNLAKEPAALAYRLVEDPRHEVVRVIWDGTTEHTAADLLVVAPHARPAPKQEEAGAFLCRVLASEARPVVWLQKAAKDKGISWDTIKRAKEGLPIIVFLRKGEEGRRGGGSWWWRLDPDQLQIKEGTPQHPSDTPLNPEPESAGQDQDSEGSEVKEIKKSTTLAGPPVDGERPKRIRLSRAKGWRLPAGAVNVARRTRWGNPHPVGKHCEVCYCPTHAYDPWPAPHDRREAVDRYRDNLDRDDALQAAAREELAGKDLACWCPLDQPCHADVLLEVANR